MLGFSSEYRESSLCDQVAPDLSPTTRSSPGDRLGRLEGVANERDERGDDLAALAPHLGWFQRLGAPPEFLRTPEATSSRLPGATSTAEPRGGRGFGDVGGSSAGTPDRCRPRRVLSAVPASPSVSPRAGAPRRRRPGVTVHGAQPDAPGGHATERDPPPRIDREGLPCRILRRLLCEPLPAKSRARETTTRLLTP